MSTAPLREIEQELAKLPPAVLEAYREASVLVESAFGEEELNLWANEGLAIGTQTVRSWESAVEYYRVAPQVARFLSFTSFMQWARCGTYLAQDSPALAVAFFRASTSIVPNLRPQYIPRWAGLGRSLYKGTWKSSTLSAKFFEASPDLVRNLPFWDVEVFASLIEALSYKSYDVAAECLALGRDVLPAMGREREAFLSMSRALIDSSWREVKTCLELVPKALQQVDENQTGRFLKLGERLAKSGLRDTSRFLADGSQALTRVNEGSQGYILDLCETLLATCSEAVPPFLRSLSDVLNRITVSQLDTWFQQGISLINDNPESGIAFFKVESSTSESLLETLSSSLELDRVKGIIGLYCRALSGTGVDVVNTQELVRKNIGWVDEDSASTDGTKVFLPSVVDHYPSKQDNFSWFKVVSTHQVSHLEFGSFLFSFETAATQFEDRRFQLERDVMQRRAEQQLEALQEVGEAQEVEEPEESGGMVPAFTDIGRFLHLFDNRRLAFDIFTVLEDCRLDHRINVEYPGIRAAARRVHAESLANRPRVQELALQGALVELLIHMSLEQFTDLRAPTDYEQVAVMLARILHQLRTAQATVEDSAEATLRAYEIISRLQNENQDEDQWQEQDLEEPGDFSEDEYQALIDKLQEAQDGSGGSGGGESYESPEPVDFRGDFKPEMVQLLARLQSDQAQDGDGQPLSKEELEQLLQDSAELELDAEQGDISNSMSMFAQNIMKEAGTPPPNGQPGQGYGPLLHDDDQGGELEPREPRTYAYDEWDFPGRRLQTQVVHRQGKNVGGGRTQFLQRCLEKLLLLVQPHQTPVRADHAGKLQEDLPADRRGGRRPERCLGSLGRPENGRAPRTTKSTGTGTGTAGTWRWSSYWT